MNMNAVKKLEFRAVEAHMATCAKRSIVCQNAQEQWKTINGALSGSSTWGTEIARQINGEFNAYRDTGNRLLLQQQQKLHIILK